MVGGEVTDGGSTELPLPGMAPGICCAMQGDASASRLPSQSVPTPRMRYLPPERLWNTALSSQLPEHTMFACGLMWCPEGACGDAYMPLEQRVNNVSYNNTESKILSYL
jgi:hypothetical protein